MEFSTESDEQLMNAVADGDYGPLNELLRRYQQRLLHFLSRLVADEDSAAELFERSFVSLFKARRLYDPSIRFATLLFGTAYSQTRAWLGANPSALAWAESPPPNDADRLSLDYRDQRIRHAMARLPLDQRATLHLCLFDNLGFYEAAQCLQTSEPEARVLFNRAYQRLRDQLGPGFIQGGEG